MDVGEHRQREQQGSRGVLRKLARVLLPILALAIGIGILVVLIKTRPEPSKKPREERGVLVEARTVESARHKLRVIAQGTVIPEQEVLLQPEVAGRVVWQDAQLVPGGRFQKGALLVRIDPRDYALAVKQQTAQVDRARLELKLEQAKKDIAKREWDIIGEDTNASELGRELGLRQPQLEVARANVKAAESGLGQARLAVGRTALRAPFNGFVKSESVDVGQLVTQQTPLATLVGTDAFWVQVAIPLDKLAHIQVPGFDAKEGMGSPATISLDVGGKRIERPGRVIRLFGDLDPVGRMARVLVEIRDPLGLKQNGDHPIPLLLGAYVEVAIEAQQQEEVIEVPRLALRRDESVYVVSKDDRLEMRAVEIAWRRTDSVLIRQGLAPGDRVITSRLPSAVPGMRLRVAAAESKDAQGMQ
jgi:RND family efflux transporter MFP subunit